MLVSAGLSEAIYLGAVREGLSDFGYVEGHNITLENRFPAEIPERFMSLAAEHAALNVNILVAIHRIAAHAAQRATTTSALGQSPRVQCKYQETLTCLAPTHDATTPVTVISSSPISRNRQWEAGCVRLDYFHTVTDAWSQPSRSSFFVTSRETIGRLLINGYTHCGMPGS